MGSHCSSDTDNSVQIKKRQSNRFDFILTIGIPESKGKSRILKHTSTNDRIPIRELIVLLFKAKSASDLKPNFIASYDKAKGSFDYCIQRVAGFEKSETKEWHFILNQQAQEWTAIYSQNTVIYYQDAMKMDYSPTDNPTQLNVNRSQERSVK